MRNIHALRGFGLSLVGFILIGGSFSSAALSTEQVFREFADQKSAEFSENAKIDPAVLRAGAETGWQAQMQQDLARREYHSNMERPATAQSAVPAGLDEHDWQAVQSQIIAQQQAERFQAVADASNGDHRAANPVHGFGIRYSADGATELTLSNQDGAGETAHRISLKPVALGYGEQLAPLSSPLERTAAGARVDTMWSSQLREWWVNDVDGLEQWFELATPPAGRGNERMRLELALHSSLSAALAGTGEAQHLLLRDGSTRVRFENLLVVDATGRRLPAELQLEADRLAYVIDDRNAVYPVTIDPTFVQQAYLKASNTDAYDRFGYSVALSDDTVVVGASWEDSNSTQVDTDSENNDSVNAGAAYVFVRDTDGTWAQQAYLKASNADAGDEFGRSVAVFADTIVIGAFREDSNSTQVDTGASNNDASEAGAAYVFVRDSNGIWTQQAYLKASNAEGGDWFGSSVAVSGNTIVVGSNREDSNSTQIDTGLANNDAGVAGAAYVFVRDTNGTWTQQAYLKASNTEQVDEFGRSVSVSGDTVVVGAIGEDSSSTQVDSGQDNNGSELAGAAYVFVRDTDGTWTQQAYLKASNTDAQDQFGSSVAVSNDTIVVGAFREDSNSTQVDTGSENNDSANAGAAYVFVRNTNGTWAQQAYLKASNSDALDEFASSVAVSGDTIVVGATGEASNSTQVDTGASNNEASGAGAAYVFVRNTDGTWAQQAYLKASNADSGDTFGKAVSVSGNWLVVGASAEASSSTQTDTGQNNNDSPQSGAAYVFDIDFTIGGTVAGLAGTGLVLQNSGGDDLLVSADGGFTFPTALADGSPYNVTVATQPTGLSQTCTVTNGSGTLAGAAVTNVQVDCVTDTFTVGGTVSGLQGTGLVLQNNSGDDLPISADGGFTFSTALADGSAYAVTIATQPTNLSQTCTVTNGSGTLAGADVTNVQVDCVTDTFTVGGAVSGFEGTGLMLQNNGGDGLSISADGAFTFPTALKDGESYSVTIASRPIDPKQVCSVINGEGNLSGGPVNDIAVDCLRGYSVSGSVSGLRSPGLVIDLNNKSALLLEQNADFTFPLWLTTAENWGLQIIVEPDAHTCTASPESGVIGGSDIEGVAVECSTDILLHDSFEGLASDPIIID